MQLATYSHRLKKEFQAPRPLARALLRLLVLIQLQVRAQTQVRAETLVRVRAQTLALPRVSLQ